MSKLVNNINSEYLAVSKLFSHPKGKGTEKVFVYVEGYEDIAFWRNIFRMYESERLQFEISIPSRDDLAKGKKVLLGMLPNCGKNMILCMDSDFDYLFQNETAQSRTVNNSEFIFQTYVYSIENYLCYPPSLRGTCVRATKNDTFIFDFEQFMSDYSRTIYPVFLWYVYSAVCKKENFFTLNDFRNTVKIHYLDIKNNGADTITWLNRQVVRRVQKLEEKYPRWKQAVKEYGVKLKKLGVTSGNVYYYMHGHTLLDNVVIVLVQTVCELLKVMSINYIRGSNRSGVALTNELSNYKNSLRDPEQVLLDNDEYQGSELFARLKSDIDKFLDKYFKLQQADE